MFTPNRTMALLLATGLLAAVGAFAGGQPRTSDPETPQIGLDVRYTVVVPRANYQAIVISPQAATAGSARVGSGEPLPFVIRTRDAQGRVSDFPFFVRIGDLHTVTFPTGWSPPTEAALFAAEGATFAAWGITAGSNGGGGQTIRFESLVRDPLRDDRDRERARVFDEFLREVQRNR
jgi:hypothetical protein